MSSKTYHMTQARAIKTLIAFTLCYVLMVQGFAAPSSMMAQDSVMMHALCLNGQSAPADTATPDNSVPSHDHETACCLIFGSSDLPRITQLISIVQFHSHPTENLAEEFQFRVKSDFSYSPSQPRAPPRLG